MAMFTRALALAVVILSGAGPLSAQEERRPLCFHPRPLDRCRAFPLYELAVTATALSSSVRDGNDLDFPPAFTATAGAMVNVTPWLAVGAQFVHSPVWEFGNARELRVRWWMGGARALDAAVGRATSKHEEPFNSALPFWDGRTGGRGPTVSLAFVPIEYVSFVARARRVQDEEGRQRRGLMFGVQTGSWSAVGLTVLAGLLGAAWFLSGGASS